MQAETDTQSQGGGRLPRRSTAHVAIAAVLALVTGIVIGSLVWGSAGLPGTADDAAVIPVATTTASQTAAPVGRPTTAPGPVVSAAAPVTAVEQFLSAEIAGDIERSFALLSASSRETFGPTVERWAATRPDALPPITDYEVLQSTAGRHPAHITTVVNFEASLDEVRGLVPGRARVTWTAVEEDDSWRVDLGGSVMEPMLPPDDGATQAARTWVERRQECRDRGSEEPLPLGDLGLAADVCGTDGPVTVGEVRTIQPTDAAPFQAAYGSEISTWARTVNVQQPIALRVVVVPIGDEWTVIGVLPEAAK